MDCLEVGAGKHVAVLGSEEEEHAVVLAEGLLDGFECEELGIVLSKVRSVVAHDLEVAEASRADSHEESEEEQSAPPTPEQELRVGGHPSIGCPEARFSIQSHEKLTTRPQGDSP